MQHILNILPCAYVCTHKNCGVVTRMKASANTVKGIYLYMGTEREKKRLTFLHCHRYYTPPQCTATLLPTLPIRVTYSSCTRSLFLSPNNHPTFLARVLYWADKTVTFYGDLFASQTYIRMLHIFNLRFYWQMRRRWRALVARAGRSYTSYVRGNENFPL